eukprot:7791639-Pyramimonas_sp.AAC.1
MSNIAGLNAPRIEWPPGNVKFGVEVAPWKTEHAAMSGKMSAIWRRKSQGGTVCRGELGGGTTEPQRFGPSAEMTPLLGQLLQSIHQRKGG